MAKIKKMTSNSWMIRDNVGEIQGILVKLLDEKYLVLSNDGKNYYDDIQSIENIYGKFKEEKNKKSKEITHINGYPIKHTTANVISENPPLYKKTGNAIFIAGYWGVKFKNGWTGVYCPKQSTIEQNESVGPFKQRLEMLNHITTLNNRDNMENGE